MSNDASLLAEAAMLRILRRTLPAQRHDVLGALSALKLQLAVARRRLSWESDGSAQAAGQDDVAARSMHLEAMAAQLRAAQTALTELRLWDGLSMQRRPLGAVIAQCIGWASQAAAMRGHQLQDLALAGHAASDGAAAGSAAERLVPVPAAHYLVLSLVYEALDRLPVPHRMTLALEPQGSVCCVVLLAQDRCDPADIPPLPFAVRGDVPVPGVAGQSLLHIDAAMGQALCVHLSDATGRWRWISPDGRIPSNATALEFSASA